MPCLRQTVFPSVSFRLAPSVYKDKQSARVSAGSAYRMNLLIFLNFWRYFSIHEKFEFRSQIWGNCSLNIPRSKIILSKIILDSRGIRGGALRRRGSSSAARPRSWRIRAWRLNPSSYKDILDVSELVFSSPTTLLEEAWSNSKKNYNKNVKVEIQHIQMWRRIRLQLNN